MEGDEEVVDLEDDGRYPLHPVAFRCVLPLEGFFGLHFDDGFLPMNVDLFYRVEFLIEELRIHCLPM